MSVSHETLTPLETRLPNNSGIHGNTCSLTYCKAPAGIMGVSPLLPVSKLALSELSLPNSRLALSSAHSLWRLQRGKLYFTSSLRARLIKHNLSEEPYSQKSSPFPFRHRRVKKRKKKDQLSQWLPGQKELLAAERLWKNALLRSVNENGIFLKIWIQQGTIGTWKFGPHFF